MAGRDEDDAKLDETLTETFPASDAPANTVETGIRLDTTPSAAVTDNQQAQRFEVVVDGQTSHLRYERTPRSLVLVHTEVPPALRGRHIADLLTRTAIEQARSEGLAIVAVCPFVKAYLRRQRRSAAG